MEVLKRESKSFDLVDICEWFLFQFFEPRTGLYEKCSYLRSRIEELATNVYLSRILTPENKDNNVLNFDEHLAKGDVVIINTKIQFWDILEKLANL